MIRDGWMRDEGFDHLPSGKQQRYAGYQFAYPIQPGIGAGAGVDLCRDVQLRRDGPYLSQ